MPKINRMKILCSLLVLIMCAGIILVLLVPVFHADEMKSYYQDFIHHDILNTAHIVDRNGQDIYNGDYAESKLTRLATFHLIGDDYDSIPTSVLAELYANTSEGNLFQGYQSQSEEIRLTIDLDLQEAAYEALVDGGYAGTVFVADYQTGEILCMVSTPSVDVKETSDNVQEGAYLNKALQTYAPGSTFKAISVACLLEKGIDPDDLGSYYCDGKDGHISCTQRHGRVNLKQALYKSCNCAISYYVEKYLTADDLDQFVRSLGILDADLIAGTTINEGTIDSSDDLAWTADGQSKTLMSPVGLASFYAALANDGVYQQFSLIQGQQTTADALISQSTVDYLKEALSTGMRVWYRSPIDCRSFGKTGTAELDSGKSHAWFACCLDDEEAPSYVIVTMLEKAGSSSKAMNLAADLINDHILTKEASS